MAGSILRKLRGFVGTGLTWGVLWAAATAGLVLVISIFDSASVGPGEGPLVAGAIVGANGFVAGIAFSALMSLIERRKTVGDLSLFRVGVWGLLASAVLPLLTAMPVGMLWFVGTLGALSASASVALAQRALPRRPAEPPALDP